MFNCCKPVGLSFQSLLKQISHISTIAEILIFVYYSKVQNIGE